MATSDKFFRVNGMQIIVDFEGVPERERNDMKCVVNCPWLTVSKKVSLLDKIKKNYLTTQGAKSMTKAFHRETRT